MQRLAFRRQARRRTRFRRQARKERVPATSQKRTCVPATSQTYTHIQEFVPATSQKRARFGDKPETGALRRQGVHSDLIHIGLISQFRSDVRFSALQKNKIPGQGEARKATICQIQQGWSAQHLMLCLCAAGAAAEAGAAAAHMATGALGRTSTRTCGRTVFQDGARAARPLTNGAAQCYSRASSRRLQTMRRQARTNGAAQRGPSTVRRVQTMRRQARNS